MNMNNEQAVPLRRSYSRRSFLQGAAVLGAATAGLGLAGCAQTAHADGAKPDPSEFFSCDVVVCGTGTAGLCAASHAAELGADVLVVEALTENGLGGNSKYVEACWVPANEEVIEDTYATLVDYHKNALNTHIARRWVNEALDIFDWTITSQGVTFAEASGLESLKATSPAVKYAEDEERGLSAGKAAIVTMYEYCVKLGVRFEFDARATELTNSDGAVSGVICERLAGTRLQVDAGAVILATGGFSANKEMFERFTNLNYDHLIAYGTSGSQRGDGIAMGLALDAALHHPEAINFCSPILPGHFNKGALTICGVNQADTIFVNERAERFCDEHCISDWALSGNIGAQQEHIYVVIDQDFVEKIETQGPVTKRTNYFKANEPVPDFGKEIEEALTRENPRVVKGSTVEDVAEQLGLDPQALKHTVDTWNEYVETGVDKDFQKKAEFMRAVHTPPFYGFKTVLAWYNNVGGLKVDEYTRVIGKNFKPIPGLYATGSDAGGLFGGCYDVSCAPGSTQMWGRASGYWAAEHAVEEYLPELG